MRKQYGGRVRSVPRSAERIVQIGFDPIFHVQELAARELAEMGRRAVRFQGGFVPVLFVEEELARPFFVAMHLKHQTAGFFAGMIGQETEQSLRLRLLTRSCFPDYGENDHLPAGCANMASARFLSSSGETSSMWVAMAQQ